MEVKRNFRKGRFIGTVIFISLFTGLVIVFYGRLALKTSPQTFEAEVPVVRGSIVDRNGKPLAVETSFYNFVVSPAAIDDVADFARKTSPILGMSEDEIVEKIKSSKSPNFMYLKKKIPQTEYDALQKIRKSSSFYSATRFDRIPGRVYPENSLASALIGFMGNDGEGLSGIEYSMQRSLTPNKETLKKDAAHGKNIYLTIDANLQYKLEKISKQAMKNTQAESMMLIAAEVKTGEILSYISLPDCNLNDYSSASPESQMDRPAMTSYEPGSVFKIFTVATLLETGVIKDTDSFFCDGIYEKKFPREKVVIKCLEHHGWVSAKTALAGSCNDALSQMAERAESEQFLANFRALGFGEKTGIELPGEAKGVLKETSDRLWSARSKPTIAIGQELTVTALQMVQATTALANRGVPVKLSVISRITNRDGTDEYVHKPEFKSQVFHESTANYLLSCMETVASRGTGHRASLGDVSIGVKTGTAQMADKVHGGYSKTDYLSNCMAVFPIENPEIVLYIVIEKAKGENYAGRIVAPVIAEAADCIIDHLGMSRGSAASLSHSGQITLAGNRNVNIGSLLPDFSGYSKRELVKLLERQDIKVRIHGDGWVKSQSPEAGTPVSEGMEIDFYLE